MRLALLAHHSRDERRTEMPKKSVATATPRSPGLESRRTAWEERMRMFVIEHDALVAEAEQREALLKSVAPIAKRAGLDLKAVTARRAAAFEKVVADLKPFLTAPKKTMK